MGKAVRPCGELHLGFVDVAVVCREDDARPRFGALQVPAHRFRHIDLAHRQVRRQAPAGEQGMHRLEHVVGVAGGFHPAPGDVETALAAVGDVERFGGAQP